jgi:hypothetical protein
MDVGVGENRSIVQFIVEHWKKHNDSGFLIVSGSDIGFTR